MDPTLGPPGCTQVKARWVLAGDTVVDAMGTEYEVIDSWEQWGFPGIDSYSNYCVDYVLVKTNGGRATWGAPRDHDWELWVRELTNTDELQLSSINRLTEIKESK